MTQHTNQLIHESSPYLLQHAHNPVNWMSWSEEALQKAKDENKPILVSIGYSSCHWCHVMEHESFEDENVAELMNEHFVCIKIDREEHPDVDAIYMNALQLITGSGGWPLNCFALPDGRPFFGGTYFPKQRWMNTLTQINHLYQNDTAKAIDYAQKIEEGIKQGDKILMDQTKIELDENLAHQMVEEWKKSWDYDLGGPNRAPKFPLPNNYEFLLAYGHFFKDIKVNEYLKTTLNEMAFGGLYDQIGGGFARYSTDMQWKVPHFEKMLYDNAQLISLYSHAYQEFKDENYATVVEEILDYIAREMTSEEGLFYSALDADSDGREGLFYIWKIKEIEELLADEAPLFMDYYQMNKVGYWEDDFYILMRTKEEESLSTKYGISVEELIQKVKIWKQKLLLVRNKRIKPGLDDKQLLVWNAMMITAYADAYMALGKPEYITAAQKAMDKALEVFDAGNDTLWHTYKNGKAKITAFHDDYALMIQALIKLYEISFEERYLLKAKALTEIVFELFFNADNGLFYFTANSQKTLVSRKTEFYDNVIPASNSVMARNLSMLSRYFGHEEWKENAQQMLHNMSPKMSAYASGFSNWGLLLLEETQGQSEVAISGAKAQEIRAEMQRNYLPSTLFAGSQIASEMPLLANRFVANKSLIYICKNQSCGLPMESVVDALAEI